MENSEICLGDKNKQLEFLKSVWKKTNTSSTKTTGAFDNSDRPNIEFNDKDKSTPRKPSHQGPYSPEFSDQSDDSEDDLSTYRFNPRPVRKRAPADDVDEKDDVIHNNFFVKESERDSQQALIFRAHKTLFIVDSGSSSRDQGESDVDGHLQDVEVVSNSSAANDSISSTSGAGGSMLVLSMSCGHAGRVKISNSTTSYLSYPKTPECMGYVKDDDFSDEAEDLDDNKESHVTNTHADSHSHAHSHPHTHAHCPHIHTHCHNKHHRHYHTHGSYHDDEDEDVNERYPFDYCSLEREPAKRQKSSNQYIGYHGTGCGQCKNCKAGKMMTTMEQLADSIDCEIHDVVPDGNCLFRSVVDQLRMNGEFGWTANTLRHRAVEYLRHYPTHEDGSHLAMFLSNETWDEYLARMSRDKEWGDQLILRGLSSVICRRISIITAIGSGHNQTTIEPLSQNNDVTNKEPLQLGHFDEQHYVSLRNKNWSDVWFENRRKENYAAEPDYFEGSNLQNYLENTQDHVTSVPFSHLHFLIKKTIPLATFKLENFFTTDELSMENVGNIAEGLECTFTSLLQISYNRSKNTHQNLGFTIIRSIKKHMAFNNMNDVSEGENQFLLEFDDLDSSPWVKLVLIKPSTVTFQYMKIRNGTAYLSAFYMPCLNDTTRNSKLIRGIECLNWPQNILDSWLSRKRFAGWPNEELLSEVIKEKCVVVPNTNHDALSWRLNFMLPIRALIKRGTNAEQRQCYMIFKMLVDSVSKENLNLPSYAVKTIFLYALEEIPSIHWEQNKGICLLHMLDKLLSCLHKKHMPDYFITIWNLLEDLTDDECKNLYSRLLATRQLPIIAVVLATEVHGLPASTVAEPLIEHIQSIERGHYVMGSEKDVFLQISIEAVKSKLCYHCYKDSVQEFVEMYEDARLSNDYTPSMEEFASSYFLDLPNRLVWWFYFFLDHFYQRRSLVANMGAYSGRTIGSLLGPSRKPGVFDEVLVPHQLLTEYKGRNLYEPDVCFLTELTQNLSFSEEYSHSAHYQMELVRLLKEKLKSCTEAEGFSNTIQGSHQANYQGQIMSLQHYVTLMTVLQELFRSLKYLKSVDLFSEYIEDAENACAIIGKPYNYYYLAQFYKELGCTEKYREAISVYNNSYTD